jgi:hypothetical protein
MADYCTLTEIKAEIPESGYSSSTDYDASISALITVASRMIDRELGRWDNFFYPTTDTVTRYYDGSGGEVQRIDEAVSISTVSMSLQGLVGSTDYTDLDATDYFTRPYNTIANAKPITHLEMDGLNGDYGTWYSFKKSVKVAGIFGYSASPPPPITQAAKIQTVRWLMRSKSGYQDVGANVEIGGIVIKGQLDLDPDIKSLLYPYKLELDNA